MPFNRRSFLKSASLSATSLMLHPTLQASARTNLQNRSPSHGDRKTMIGMQLDKEAFAQRDLDEVFAEMRSLAPINAIFYFFDETDLKLPAKFTKGDGFTLDDPGYLSREESLLYRMFLSARKHGMDLYPGGGEFSWNNCSERFPDACEKDYLGLIRNTSCVNHPQWRDFQFRVHSEIFREYPELSGFLPMHERTGPLMKVLKPEPWQGIYNPGCFCEHCLSLAKEKGIDAARSRKGFQKLVSLFRDGEQALVRDGIMTGFWRVISEYPEVMAWEYFQWESLTRYRKDFALAVRGISPQAMIGYHFQHSASSGDLPWRAGDRPEAALGFADWVKPSIYPGCSGRRYKDLLDKSRETYLGDMNERTAHLAMSAWFQRDPENGRSMLGEDPADQESFLPGWCESETHRFVEGAHPLPVYAGLGIGVPGGEKIETPKSIRESTLACLKGGAEGFIVSRHYSEIRPDLLRAFGEALGE